MQKGIPVLLLLLLLLLLPVSAFTLDYLPSANTLQPGDWHFPSVIHPTAIWTHSSSPGFSGQNSSNWSGYVIPAAVGAVTDVKGSWIVPNVSCGSTDTYSAVWVGIDGWNSPTVEQIGTESDCFGGGPSYSAWFEFYPAPESTIGDVSPGDVISASVTCRSDGLLCTVSITDVTSGGSFSHSRVFSSLAAPRLDSAEWIVEAPSSSTGENLPLANFGVVYFGSNLTGAAFDSATINGISGTIGSFGTSSVQVTMIASDGSIVAQPSALSLDGNDFEVIRPLVAGQITPVDPTIGSGRSALLTSNPSGGVPPYAVTWYSATGNGVCSRSDHPLVTALAYIVVPTNSSYYCYIVTDSAFPPSSAGSPTDFVTVLPPLAPPSLSLSSSAVNAGQSVLISTNTTFVGGVPLYTCQWLERPPSDSNFSNFGAPFARGCVPSTKLSKATGPVTQVGTWAFELRVTDSDGITVTSPAISLVVNAPKGPTLTVSCTPDPVTVGTSTTCTVVAQGSQSTPTGSVQWSSSVPGHFSVTSCTLVKGACSLRFTPKASNSTVDVVANYRGDSRNAPSSGTYFLSVGAKVSKTSVSCAPSLIQASSTKHFTCRATVSGYSPTGNVTWSQDGSGSISFVTESCALSKGTCSVTLNGVGPGKVTLHASYGGDSNNLVSLGSRTVTVGKEATSVLIACDSTSLSPGQPVMCTVTVNGYNPTGTISWSKVSGTSKLVFSLTTCTLESGSCSITLSPASSGSVKVRATYLGDSNNLRSSGTAVLTIG